MSSPTVKGFPVPEPARAGVDVLAAASVGRGLLATVLVRPVHDGSFLIPAGGEWRAPLRVSQTVLSVTAVLSAGGADEDEGEVVAVALEGGAVPARRGARFGLLDVPTRDTMSGGSRRGCTRASGSSGCGPSILRWTERIFKEAAV